MQPTITLLMTYIALPASSIFDPHLSVAMLTTALRKARILAAGGLRVNSLLKVTY